jgi:L-rhamnose-H+ transport protein
MSESLLIGIGLTMIAGLMSGNCMLPMKFVRSWKWEHVWLVFSVVSLLVIPWALAFGLVGNLFETYQRLSPGQLAIPFSFGIGWGIAQVLFGISVARLGLALAYAIIVGLSALLGTLVPLFVQLREGNAGHTLALVLTGVTVMVAGICLASWAGQLRENEKSGISAQPRQGYLGALMLAILCGLAAPMLNYSFAFGQDIAKEAIRLGTPQVRAGYAVWPVGLAGGFIPNVAYSLYLLSKNHSWAIFRSTPLPDGLRASLMGVLWMGAFSLYGMGALYLGSFGTSIGWGLLQIFMILTATLSGVLTGEWNRSALLAKQILGLGLTCLVGATVLLALANR